MLHERLHAARDRSGLTLQQVSDRSEIGVSSISEFENGSREPSVCHLQSLADAYHVPITYFFEDHPLREPSVLWRSCPAAIASNEIRNQFLELCRQYHDLEMWCNEPQPARLPTSGGNTKKLRDLNVDLLVANVHKQLDLGNRPGQALTRILEEVCGVKIFHHDFNEDCAACTGDDTYGAAILLNRNASRAQRNFDAAHELFHLITWKMFRHSGVATGHQGMLFAGDEEEELANYFARALLMPRDAVLEAVSSYLATKRSLFFDDMFDLARQFEVEVEILMVRVGEIYSIDKAKIEANQKRYRETAKQRHDDIIKSEEKDHVPNRPLRFRALAFRALHEGEISQGKFAKYMEMSRRQVAELIDKEIQQEKESNEEVELTPA